MEIWKSRPPAGATKALEANVEDFLPPIVQIGERSWRAQDLVRRAWHRASAHAVPFFVLHGDVPELDELCSLRPSGWRYFLFDSSTPFAIVDVLDRFEGRAVIPDYVLSQVSIGAFPNHLYGALNQMERHSNFPDAQTRIVDAPEIDLYAIWLHGRQLDIVFPLEFSRDGEVRLSPPLDGNAFLHTVQEKLHNPIDYWATAAKGPAL